MPMLAVGAAREHGLVAPDSNLSERLFVCHGRSEDFAVVPEADEAPVEEVVNRRVQEEPVSSTLLAFGTPDVTSPHFVDESLLMADPPIAHRGQ